MPVTLTNTAIQFNDGTSQSSAAVNKAGDTMTGNLTIQNTSPTIVMADTDNVTRQLHVNSNLMGFLNSSGSWDMYANNSGQVWTSNYGWLHDRFAERVSTTRIKTQAAEQFNTTRTNGGAGWGSNRITASTDGTSNEIIMQRIYYTNCNCDCNCACGW